MACYCAQGTACLSDSARLYIQCTVWVLKSVTWGNAQRWVYGSIVCAFSVLHMSIDDAILTNASVVFPMLFPVKAYGQLGTPATACLGWRTWPWAGARLGSQVTKPAFVANVS